MDENEIKFLVIRFSSIGDIVLTTPIVRCLKQQVEGAVVHFLTKPAYASILESNPYIDKVHTLGNFHASINELRDEGFDYIIDLHKNIRTFRFKHKLKIMDFSFDKLNSEKFFLVNFKKNKLIKHFGKFGPFYGCSGYFLKGKDKCKGTFKIGKNDEPIEKEKKEVKYIEGVECDKCGSKMVIRISKKTGKEFYGCISYPKCRGMLSLDGKPIEFKKFKKK